MRSRDSLGRRSLEMALRVASLALVAWMIWAAVAPSARDSGTTIVQERHLPALLSDPVAQQPSAVHVLLDTVPDRVHRDWLVAMRRSGTRIAWSSPSAIPASAIEVLPTSDPAGGARVLVAAPRGTMVTFADATGPLDSAHVAALGVSFSLFGLDAPARATVGRQVARAAFPDSLLPHRLLVVGQAGWESKFVLAALEERGWEVDARLRVAPVLDVVQGAPSRPDTSRYAVVVVLDSAAARAVPDLVRYVREGGGVVLAGNAGSAASLSSIVASTLGERVRAATIAFAADAPRRALGFYQLTALRPDAVRLEARDGRVAVAARRVGTGRVVQTGYDETWRWRFADSDDAPLQHRAWWAALIDAAAYRAARPVATTALLDAAPRAALFGALGAPTVAPTPAAPSRSSRALRGWMLPLLLILLLAEWTSRRFRGAP